MGSRSRSWQARSVASASVGGAYGDASEVRASIGDTHVESAISKLNRLMRVSTYLMVSHSPSREGVLPGLFADDTLIKLQAVRGMVETRSDFVHYRIAPDVDLYIDFKDATVPAIQPQFLFVQPDRASPLLNAIEEIRAVYVQYEKVKHVVRWLNRNATVGAIRHYWPAALELCPQSPIPVDPPSRFASPPDIGKMLNLIRETAATVAKAVLIPGDATPRERKKLWLTFRQQEISDGSHTFKTDEMVIHL